MVIVKQTFNNLFLLVFWFIKTVPDISSPFEKKTKKKTVTSLLPLHHSTRTPRAYVPCSAPWPVDTPSTPSTPSFASSPVLLPHGEISHSSSPGRRSPPADKAVAAEGAASPPPLHMFAEIGSSAYQCGTFTFSPYPSSLPSFLPPSLPLS